jgi:hypothetical protein
MDESYDDYEILQEENDDEVASMTVQTMLSLSTNYNQPIDPYELVGISVYRELQRRRTLLALEQAMTVEVLLGMLSQRVANSTRSALRDMDMAVDEELLGLLFDVEPPGAKRPEATRECKEEEETCSICLTPVVQGETIYDIPCKHCFHKSCLDKWLDRRKESCPMCRQKMV